ncbi:hypothetical protein V6N11_058545 [Hibiscus sabdariffa]|uniref:Uncharacterized protein n=1 Tax=Hibiscus sabdariffa TaxID=183260 RepID=A0ABR2U4N8_9ROSI
MVEGHSYPIRISEVETFLRGPRCSCPCVTQSSTYTNFEQAVDSIEQDIPGEQAVQADGVVTDAVLKGVEEKVSWRGNGLWEGLPVASSSILPGCEVSPVVRVPCLPSLDPRSDWVSMLIVDGFELKEGPHAEGSTTNILLPNGCKKKVRMLTNVIQSVLPPQEKLRAEKQSRKGRG